MGEERRRAVRINTTLFVQYSLDNGDTKRWDITAVKNISESGLCILTGKKFGAGEKIPLRVKIPSRPFDMIEVTGRVVSSSESQTGAGSTFITRIEFDNLSEDTQKLFREYVDWFLKNSGAK